MKFFHLSDLHIGKQLNGYSLRENQEEVFNQVADLAACHRPDAILICGDVYDKSIPSGEAFTLFDWFLGRLEETGIPALIIAGNHDSPERLNFAASFLEKHRIYLSVFPPRKKGEYLKQVTLTDPWGKVNFYLFPFMKPGYVRGLLEEEAEGAGQGFGSYDQAFRAMIAREAIREEERNVILAHQFFASGEREPETCESESAVITAGGLDRIDSSVLSVFDYAALGHLHGPQQSGRPETRYCGSPFKYSVSEEHHQKSVTMVELGQKGEKPILTFLPLKGKQEVRRLRGTLEELTRGGDVCSDFVSLTLTDEREAYQFRDRLREKYDHILEIRLDNERTRQKLSETGEELPALSPMESFEQFFRMIRHCPMTEEEEELMKEIMEEAKEGED